MQVTTIDQFDDAANALIVARNNLVLGAKSNNGLISVYASSLCTMFDVRDDKGARVTAWYELKGKAKSGVKAERDQFVKSMQEAGFGTGTTDVYWQRVKEASGYVTAGNRVKGSLDVDAKTTSELLTILNRIFKAEEEGNSTCEKSSQCKGALMVIFEELGGDLDKIGT
jgi:hypothetical protein